MNPPMIKTRFAPSPTGLLHSGNLRTALFNALFAWRHQGVFLLRMEDTDPERSRTEYAEHLMEDLRWLGLVWQEGPQAGGSAGPYWQSQRGEIYENYYRQLEQQDLVYPCFCSAQELAVSRKLQRIAGQAPRYAGTCAHLSKDEAEAKKQQGLQATVRFRVPRGESVVFTDLVRGEQRFACDDIGDFIIRRANGTPAFFFCNAVDDALMDVSHVFRGEDHLTNTPRQLLLLQALKLNIPAYGHISMIVGQDNSPLSKRHGSQSIREMREEGRLAGAVTNYLARLGHRYSDDSLMELSGLAEQFEVDRLGRAPAHFDIAHMNHWQQLAVAHASTETLWQWMGSETHKRVPEKQRGAFIGAIQANISYPPDALEWAQRIFTGEWEYSEEARQYIETAGTEFFVLAAQALEQNQGEWKNTVAQLKNSAGKKGKALFMPLRAALTGLTHGPEMGTLLPLIGLQEALVRLQRLG